MGSTLTPALEALVRASREADRRRGGYVAVPQGMDPGYTWLRVWCDDLNRCVTCAFEYEPSIAPRITSTFAFVNGAGPGEPGCDAEIELVHAIVAFDAANQPIDIADVLRESTIADLQRAALHVLEPQ